MGGEESEITDSTREVMLECATFDRAVTRISARRMGIRTESSGRFERGVSEKTIMTALERACQLVNLLDAGDVVGGHYDCYEHLEAPKTIVCSVRRIAARTGVDITGEEMEAALRKLCFTRGARGRYPARHRARLSSGYGGRSRCVRGSAAHGRL